MKPAPLHERIRAEIEGAILSGALAPGSRIPSELELMGEYGCARMTVNKALSALAAAGLVSRRKRAGTVVAHRRTESMVLDVPDLAVEIAARGQAYRYAPVERRVIEGGAIPLPGSGRTLFVSGAHHADDVPLAYEERWISLEAVPEIEAADFADMPPGSWLLRHIPWTEAENRIGAEAADRACAAHLRIAPAAACLTIERRTWRGEESITFVRQHFVAGRYALTARFGAGTAST
jgi:GntR family histidine utilization transcriptional repressor